MFTDVKIVAYILSYWLCFSYIFPKIRAVQNTYKPLLHKTEPYGDTLWKQI